MCQRYDVKIVESSRQTCDSINKNIWFSVAFGVRGVLEKN